MDGKSHTMYWVLTITWKRRKDKPSEPIAMCSGGVLHILFFHKELAKQLKIPESWIDFKLYTRLIEVKRVAPQLYKEWAQKKLEVRSE